MPSRLRAISVLTALTVGLTLSPGPASAASTRTPKAPASLVAATPAAPTPDAARLQAALDELTAAGAPAALAEVRVGDTVWSGASGVRDLRTGQAARAGDRYRVASVTKAMTATVALQLADEGRLTLDDPVARHLPGVLPYRETITLRQLLNHTSGIPDYFDELYPTGSDAELEKNRFRHHTPRELIDAATRKPLGPIGTFAYSNTNYLLIGLVVESVTGRPLGRELRDRIFRPAGMKDTSYPDRSPVLTGPHVHGYRQGGSGRLVDTTVYTPSVWGAAAGVVSTSGDINRFFRALSDGTLLSSARLGEMRTMNEVGYGLGVMGGGDLCPTAPGDLVWGNMGNGFGYRSQSWSSPDGRRQVTFGWTVTVPGVVGPPKVEAAVREFLVAALGATCAPTPVR
ncbi:serine hydrolase domain-containing protein [Streptomyces sp. SP18CS02]|uniref:serine hydrolase domain-containing protein n=1 Tax=Streptomyces sp. SP18CS02 TaxID=3002531 RepID=UPI002E75EE99|nr:serine hydrolase domain-containing protein [Streptomyces sp. SP18CS02]MEE1750972.1 serine hydrolase [Streptomyces sp. SP18CS02]